MATHPEREKDIKEGKSKGKLRSITIRPASNGYTVEVHRDPPMSSMKGDKGIQSMPYDINDRNAVFEHKEHALTYIGKQLD